MNAGDLRHRIEFGRFKKTTNTQGFKENTWVPEFKAWASIKNLYGREFWEAKAVQGETTVKFRCRYNSKIESTMFIKFQDNYYEVIGNPDDINYLHRELEIKAKILEKEKLNVSEL
jgi:SPP1 family predicted phage head-tail adaptor